MTPRERVLAALRLETPDKVPFMDLGVDYGLGRQLLGKEIYEPWEPADILEMDAVGTPIYPDLYVEQKELNGRMHITDGKIKEYADLKQIHLRDSKDPALYETLKRVIANNKERGSEKEKAVFCSTNMGIDPVLLNMGMDGFSYACYDEPETVTEMLKIYTEWTIGVVEEVQKLGVDFIWFTDDIAFNTSLMFSPELYRELILPDLKQVTKTCSIPMVYHSDGYVLPVIEDLLSLGIAGLHPIDPSALDIHKMKEEYGERVCLLGNIDLRHTLVNGSKEEVFEEVKDRIQTVGKNGGYILTSGNSFTDYCKAENVLAVRDAIRAYGCYE